MSLASDYAAAQAVATADQATVTASVPAPFVGPNGRAEVTPTGNLRLVPTTTGEFQIPAAAALAFAAWVTATFGEP
jgi:hypothetical protein